MRRPSAHAALLLLLSAPAVGTPQEPPPVFPAKADLVRLDLVVRDEGPAESRPGPAKAPAAPAAAPAAGGPAGDGLVSVVALVFDPLGPEAARNARAAALPLAGRSFPKGSVFAVFKIGQGLKVLQSFTEDRALLPATIEKATTGVDRARDPSRSAEFDNATEEAFTVARGEQQGGGGLEGMLAADTASDALRLNRQGVLGDLAESTGGFLVAETNDLRPGLERVVSDLRAYYEVGYTPPNPKADGRWRAISVKVSRPGVVVRTRRGYYALPPGAPVVLPYEMPLAEALAASPMPRDVEHRAATLRFAGGEAETETLVWVEVPLAGLTLARGETTYRGHVSLLGQVKDETGTLVARLSHDAPIEGPLAEIDSARAGTTVVKRTLRLPPGRYVLETAVQDRESGRVGARRAAFEIPAPGPALSLGSVALVRADEVGSAGPGAPGSAGEPATGGASDDPLRVGHLKATPLLGKSVPEGTPAVSFLLSLHAGPGTSPAEVELELRRGGQAVTHARPDLPGPDASGRVTYIGNVPAAGLAPGRYEVWVRGRLGEAEATEATAFTITPRAPVAAAAPSRTPGGSELPSPPGSIEDRKNVATPLTKILERAGQYVLRYEETFRNLVAEESYRQWGPNPKGGEGQVARTLRSDLVFVRLPGPLSWGTFRDVYEVDGQKVRDRQRRLEKLFFAPKASEYEQAEAILNESSRYNLGRAYRNINAPALGLLFLRPENQRRLAFKRKGNRTIAGFPTAEVAFEEKASPTLVHDRWGSDVPASGRFWIDETRGTVLRTEIEYDLETEKTTRSPDVWERGLVSTEYRREIGLECVVPDTMTELYNFRGIGRIEGVARYASYRRFEVSVGTAEVLPLSYGAEAVDASEMGSLPAGPPPPLDSRPSPETPPPSPPTTTPDLETVPAPALPGEVGSLLQKAGDYVVRYERAFRNVVAVEDSDQRYDEVLTKTSFARKPDGHVTANQQRDTTRTTRRLRSEIVFAMLPGPVPWTAFRDVIEVDGHPVGERGRLEQAFRESPSAGFARASALSRDSRRQSLGPESRTPIAPTMALGYLHPDNRDRFAFERKGRGKGGAIEVAFTEVARPALVQDAAGADMPARGRLLLRSEDGAVLRTEVEFRSAGANGRSLRVTTAYRPDPTLALLVPVEMEELYEATAEAEPGLGGGGAASPRPAPAGDRLETTARYSGYHRVVP